MRNLLSTLNDYSGAIQAFCAFVIAAMTGLYVFFTKRMWKEMRQTNERLEKPNVQALLELRQLPSMLAFQLAIRNAGGTPVYSLSVDVIPKHLPGPGSGAALDELNFFKRTIPVLAERESITVLLPRRLTHIIWNGQDSVITFEVAYEASGKSLHQTYKYDLSIYKELGIAHESDETMKKVIEGGIRSLNSTLVENRRETNNRLEWPTLLNPISVESNVILQTMLCTFQTAWRDYAFLNDRGLTAFSDEDFRDYKMRVLCEKLYDSLCSQASEEYEELRRTLLRMARYDYRTNEEYLSLGDAAVVMIQQINENHSSIADLPISSPWG